MTYDPLKPAPVHSASGANHDAGTTHAKDPRRGGGITTGVGLTGEKFQRVDGLHAALPGVWTLRLDRGSLDKLLAEGRFEVNTAGMRFAVELKDGPTAAGQATDETLRDAVEALYYAAWWIPDRQCAAVKLWEDVRDAAGLERGEATKRLGKSLVFTPKCDCEDSPPEGGHHSDCPVAALPALGAIVRHIESGAVARVESVGHVEPAATPASGKPIGALTDDELIAEWREWDTKIANAKGWGAGLAAASGFRDECAREILKRGLDRD